MSQAKIYEGNTSEGRRVKVVSYPAGVKVGNVATACPEEGWLDMWVLDPADGPGHRRVLVDRQKQELVKVRVHQSYDLVNVLEEKVVASVRWTTSRPAQLTVTRP